MNEPLEFFIIHESRDIIRTRLYCSPPHQSSSDAHGALSFAPAADSETERLRRLEQRRRDEQRAIRDALLEQKMEGEDGGEGATADEILGAITLQQTESKELEKRLENAVQRVAVLKQVLAAAQGVAAAAAPSGGGLGKGGGEQESQQLRGQDGGAAQSNVVLDFEGEQILAELRAKAKEARIAEAVSEKGGEDFEGASSAPTDPAEQRALAEKLGKECAELRELREKLEKEMKSTLAPRKTELMRPELIRVQSQLQDEEAEKIEERRLQQLLTSSQEALEALTAKKDEICGALNSGKKLAWSAEEDAREIKIRQAAALLEMGTEEERLHTDIRDVQDDLKTAHLAIDSENAAQEEFQKELDLKKDKHPSLVSGAREISSLEQEEAHLADLSEENLALQSKIDMLRHKVQQDQSARLAEGGGAGGVGGLLAAVKIQRRSLLGVGTVAKRKSGQVGVGAAAGTVGVFGASSPVASPSTGAAVSGATTNVSQETGDGGAAAPPPEQQDSPRDELTELLVKAGFAHRKHDIEQLLRLQQENKEMNAQIINLEGKIKLAKNASKSGEKIDEDFLRQIHELGAGGGGDGAEPPPELAWLKKDCKIQQRELNGLRNRWWNNRFDLAADLLGEGYQTSSEEEDAIAKTEVDAVEDGPRPPGRRGEKDWVNVEGESFRDASAKIEGLTGRRATLSVAAAGGTGGGPLGDQSPVESAISKLRQGAGSVPTLGIFAKRVVAAPPPARKKSLSSTVLDSRAAHIRAASEVRVEGLSVLVNGAAENNEFIKPARSVMRGGLLVERQREQAALLSGLRIGGAVSHGRGAEQSTPPPKSSTKKVLLMQSSTASPRSDQIAHGAGAGSRSPVGKGSPSSSITRNLQPGQVGEDEVPTHKGKATVEVDHNPNVQNQKSGQTLVSMLNRRRMMLRQMDGTASEGGIRLEVSTTPRSPRPPEVKR